MVGGSGAVLRDRHPERVELQFIDNAGHAHMPEQPDETARLVLEALSDFTAVGEADKASVVH